MEGDHADLKEILKTPGKALSRIGKLVPLASNLAAVANSSGGRRMNATSHHRDESDNEDPRHASRRIPPSALTGTSVNHHLSPSLTSTTLVTDRFRLTLLGIVNYLWTQGN